jgi:superfamily II DNA or RNA helicase
MVLNGYIYVRFHESYDKYNACKLGKTLNIPDRENGYIPGEILRGHFEIAFEVSYENYSKIEIELQKKFKDYNIKINAGTEFYNKEIITKIEQFLLDNDYNYKKLTKEEIKNLIRTHRIKKITNKIKKIELINCLLEPKPRKDQEEIINTTVRYLQDNDKGMLILMCGIGKTLISLWISERLKTNTILIGVPNILLLKQWKKEVSKILKNIPYLIVSGDINIKTIELFLQNNYNNCIIITTYSSSYKVKLAAKNLSFIFNMKILDEVHHLTSNNITISNETKSYIQILDIPTIKQLSLTATIKQLENNNNDNMIISNDNIEYFGEIIEKKCLLWAIDNKIVCDYVVQTIITDEEELEDQLINFNIIEENDKRLFLSAYASLKSIFEGHSHHLLIYSNNTNNSLKLKEYINMLITNNYFDTLDIFYSNYDSKMTQNEQEEIIYQFKKAKYGIITCVYCLGEGWDFPLLDGVVFAENMTSNIRIVQSALRASRKNKYEEPNKITKIILPILNRDNWLENNENSDLRKVREVIYQMGLEDETIEHKIKVYKVSVKKHKPKQKEIKTKEPNYEFGDYDDEITKTLRLKTIKRTALATTYEKARKIIVEKNIKNKQEYYNLCEIDNRLSKEPELVFKGQFTNWIEYLSIERTYYDLQTCKNKVSEYLLLYPEIKANYLNLSIVVNNLCKLDALFPPDGLWVEYYNVKDLKDIINIINKKSKVSILL